MHPLRLCPQPQPRGLLHYGGNQEAQGEGGRGDSGSCAPSFPCIITKGYFWQIVGGHLVVVATNISIPIDGYRMLASIHRA